MGTSGKVAVGNGVIRSLETMGSVGRMQVEVGERMAVGSSHDVDIVDTCGEVAASSGVAILVNPTWSA